MKTPHNQVRPFSEEEVKKAMWDWDNNKSPGIDGNNFGFTKEFQLWIKADFFRFLVELHQNGKLVKGSNCTFIALVPNFENQ